MPRIHWKEVLIALLIGMIAMHILHTKTTMTGSTGGRR